MAALCRPDEPHRRASAAGRRSGATTSSAKPAEGALFVGSPETVAAKIVTTVKALGLSRFDLKYSNGTLPHDMLMKSIELYGTKVVPLVRDRLRTESRAERRRSRV